ncbi:MAG: pyruvate formate lyase family protein [Lentisphaerota bacterium]
MSATLSAIDFGVATGEKPLRRLPEATRQLAACYLSGAIGRSVQPASFAIPDSFYEELPSPNRQYAEAVRLIAAQAPLRILPGEKLAGAATLQEAMQHAVPLLRQSSLGSHPSTAPTPLMSSVSHTTLGFDKALRVGYRGIRAEIHARRAREGLDPDGEELLRCMLDCLDAAAVWHGRHVQALEERVAASADAERQEYEAMLAALRNVPEKPPSTFREAVQALWLLWDFQRLCGNWSGLGRVDKMLGPYLAADLAAGRITLDEARDLLAHFWIKGCEWITADGRGSGDAQFYQNVVLAGVDENGREVANDVTDLILDVVEELHISDFPIAVRISKCTPERLLRRVAAIQRLGGGIVAIYNEDRIIPTLVKFGYPLEEARDFANDGCWELLIPGKTCFGYQAFDALQLLQDTLDLGAADMPAVEFATFDELYEDFRRRLESRLSQLLNETRRSTHPTVLVDLLVDGCVESGRSYYDLGPRYTALSPHPGGLPDVVDSLLAIRRLVFEEQRLSRHDFVATLRADWQGREELRQWIRARFGFFGGGSAESEAMMRRVFDDFTGFVGKVRQRHGVLRPAGISTFGRESSDYLPHRMATASGHRKGERLASNFTPSPGSNAGPTAAIAAHCCVDFSRLPCGTALDLKIHPESVRGAEGLQAMVGLFRTFVELGGIFLQIDVVDAAILRDAQAHPERYPNLSVRVSGWSARFATLNREWQELILSRMATKGK